MADYTERLTNAESMKFIDQVGEPFKNLPHLPQGIVDFFVMVAPWLALLGGVLGIIFGPLAFITGTLVSVLTLSPLLMIGIIGSTLISTIQAVLMLLAFNPLKNRETKGWVLVFWSEVLSGVVIVFNALQGNISSIIGGVIGLAIGFYIIFEMRSSYGVVASAAKAVKDEVQKLD